jgi:hypothetical protein
MQKPDGGVVQYDPLICAVAVPDPLVLAPARDDNTGEDRYSREIFLTYGGNDFYFGLPGEYRIRAVYQGPSDALIPSQAYRLRIGVPASKELDRAQDYFTDEVGLTLYLQGSRSPYLKTGGGFSPLVNREKRSSLGLKVAVALANGLAGGQPNAGEGGTSKACA